MTTLDLESVVANATDVIPSQSRKKATTKTVGKAAANDASKAGRKRFAEEICKIHGADEAGNPCSRFAHLRGDGRGEYQPGIFRQFLVIIRALFKPLFITGIIGAGGFLILFWFSHILQSGSFVPGSTGGMSNRGRSTPANNIHYCRVVGDVIPTGCAPGDKILRVK